jgi:hypothetical protein
MMRSILFLVLIVLVPSVVAAKDVSFEASNGTVPHLKVELFWGRIVVATHDQAYATIEARGESNVDGLRSLNEPRLVIDAADGRIAVKQPTPERGNFRSAEITVLVPVQCNLELVMLRGGDIDVSQVEGEISITNLNGSVALKEVAGAALVNASNGAIEASFRAVADDLDLQFMTLNGSVELCMPETFSAHLALFTEGDPILTDFDVQPATLAAADVPTGKRRGREAVTGRIGTSDRWLTASTLNGEIRLQRCRQ